MLVNSQPSRTPIVAPGMANTFVATDFRGEMGSFNRLQPTSGRPMNFNNILGEDDFAWGRLLRTLVKWENKTEKIKNTFDK